MDEVSAKRIGVAPQEVVVEGSDLSKACEYMIKQAQFVEYAYRGPMVYPDCPKPERVFIPLGIYER